MENDVFKIACEIANDHCTKSVRNGVEYMHIQGRASGNKVDLEAEVMSDSVLESFQKAIENGITLPDGEWSQIPLLSEHRKDWNATLGYLTKAWISDGDLWIEAELENANPNAHYLFHQLTATDKAGRPVKKLGLSVGGRVLDAVTEWQPAVQKMVRKFTAVDLGEVSVTARPAYPTAFLSALTKSVNWTQVESDKGDIMGKNIEDAVNERKNVANSEEATKETPPERRETFSDANIVEEDNPRVESVEGSTPLVGEENPTNDDMIENNENVKKSTAFGNWSLSEVSSGAITSLSYALNNHVYDVMLDKSRSVAERMADVNTLFDDFKRVLSGVIEPLLEAGADDVMKAFQPIETGANMDFEKSINELTERLNTLTEKIEKSAASEENTEQEAVVKTVTEESVASTTEQSDLVKSLSEALSASILPELKAINQRLTVVENTEVDKSLSVSAANTLGDARPVEKSLEQAFEEQLDGITDPAERLRLALRAFHEAGNVESN